MYVNPYKGKFIAFEGPDGSGQSTQVSFLAGYLEKHGIMVTTTKEPTEGVVGRKIRAILQKKETIDPYVLQVFFAKDREEHLREVIIPALDKGEVVISDRYYLSSIAFGSLDCEFDKLFALNDKFILPDATLSLDVSPSVCVERISKRGEKKELFEESEKLKQVYNAYKFLAKLKSGVYSIDGDMPIMEVHKNIAKIIQSLNWWPNKLANKNGKKCPA